MRRFNPGMEPHEGKAWAEEKLYWMRRKMQREQSYLSRRAGRGVHTPTDEAYEEDQPHEEDLVCMLESVLSEYSKLV